MQPVLDWAERAKHPHLVARETIVEAHGIEQAAPAPRMSRTPLSIQRAAPLRGEHSRAIAAELGRSDEDVEKLLAAGTITEAS